MTIEGPLPAGGSVAGRLCGTRTDQRLALLPVPRAVRACSNDGKPAVYRQGVAQR